jgi:diguanylate cyclase (GGDEF)-like protein
MVDGGLGLTGSVAPLSRLVARVRGPWALIGGLAVAAAVLTPAALSAPWPAPPGLGPGGPTLSWWMLAPLFALAEVFVVHVEFNRDAHTFTLSELPFVLALLLATPQDLLVARIVGAAIALALVERQPATKLTFNLVLFWAESCLALLTFQLLCGPHPVLDARTWSAAALGVGAACLLGVLAVWAVIRLHGGDAALAPLLLVSGLTAACNACLAGVTAVVLTSHRWALLPLAGVVVVAVVAYRRYSLLAKRYAGMRAMYTFSRATGEAVTHEQVLTSVLTSARQLLHAGTAAIELCPADGDDAGARTVVPPSVPAVPEGLRERVVRQRKALLLAAATVDPDERALLDGIGVRDGLIAPLISGRDVIGTLLVADRLGDVTTSFDADDAELLTTLAVQAGVALEKGRLLQQAHDQARAREYEALHDALTGLPNRTLFSRELDRALQAARRNDARTAVLLMDLDQFKEVNDTLGHHTGDRLLQQVAERLSETVAGQGLVARLGGDEFAVLLPQPESDHEALDLARRLHARMTEPVRLASLRLEIGASIGVALRPVHGDDGEILLQRADVAMYAAKRARERVALYDPDSDWSSPTRLRLAADLRAALAGRQLTLLYQPIARVDDLDVTTVEALARWPHPELGDLGPEEFIPIAERTGLIGPLTGYVLERAIGQAVGWRAAGLDVRVAVNLSVQILLDAEWPATVLALLRSNGLPPDRLIFEITETSIMSDPQSMIPLLDELAAAGVAFSIDDFGTGHSSFSYLQRLPVSEVKIDKSFVLPMATDPNAASIVRSVVDLARNLSLRTIAEGVENQTTLDRLGEMRCDCLQGFYLSRPLPGEELTRWLLERQRLSA